MSRRTGWPYRSKINRLAPDAHAGGLPDAGVGQRGQAASGVSGAGRVYALNGKVRARFTANPSADCYFGSLNGNVEITFRPQLSANVLLKTFNGQVYSDFPVRYLPSGKPTKKTKDGKLIYKSNVFFGVRVGDGGPELKFDAFNCDIRILSRE